MLNGFRLTLGVLLLAAPAPLAAGVLGSKYQSAGRCGPYWRAAVKTPAPARPQ